MLNVARSEDEAIRQAAGEDVTVVKDEVIELQTFDPEVFEEGAAPAESAEEATATNGSEPEKAAK